MKKRVGLFFGSFNPIHVGHMMIAEMVHTSGKVDEVWFVVSPHNPHKRKEELLPEQDRLDLVREAIGTVYHLKVSDIEFNLPKPSYTIHTMTYLAEKYPDYSFQLIIGEDNLHSLPKWMNYEQLLMHGLLVYPRPNTKPSTLAEHPQVTWVEAPKIDISATMIRKLVKADKSVKYLVPDGVAELIESRKYYK
jgi:nicotinate-nucleotide adenylyltransferase